MTPEPVGLVLNIFYLLQVNVSKMGNFLLRYPHVSLKSAADDFFHRFIAVRQILSKTEVHGGYIRQPFVFIIGLYAYILAEQIMMRTFMTYDGDDFVKRILLLERYMYFIAEITRTDISSRRC